jgi:hypothetical protein
MAVIRRDPERLKKLRVAIRYLLREDALERGHQTRLAEHFSVTRQRVHQVVNEEQVRREQAADVKRQMAELRARCQPNHFPNPQPAPSGELPFGSP